MNLKGGGQANVAVFNLEAMILSLVLDENLMHPNNCCKPPRYVLYKGTYVPYDGTYGASDQGQMLDV